LTNVLILDLTNINEGVVDFVGRINQNLADANLLIMIAGTNAGHEQVRGNDNSTNGDVDDVDYVISWAYLGR